MRKIIGQIYSEDDYTVFKRLAENRDVTPSRVNKLIASISERYVLNPIVVNENMEVIDGQGRFDARRTLRLPIHYIVAEGADINDCQRMNKYNSIWTALDYAISHAKGGKEAYIVLLKTCKESGFPISRVLRLANHGTRKSKYSTKMSAFEAGNLVFDENDMKMVMVIKQRGDELLKALQFTKKPNDAFHTGFKIAFETEGYDHATMLNNAAVLRDSYQQMSSLSGQLMEFERIYNYRKGKDKRLYFSDYLRDKGSNVRDYSKTSSPYDDVDISTLST